MITDLFLIILYTLSPQSSALVPSKGLHIAEIRPSSTATSAFKPGKPLWRKREVVRQERTVHYTTVDAEGVQQVRTTKVDI